MTLGRSEHPRTPARPFSLLLSLSPVAGTKSLSGGSRLTEFSRVSGMALPIASCQRPGLAAGEERGLLKGRVSVNGLGGLAIAAAAMLLVALVVGAAEGKKKSGGGGKLTVLTTQQHQAVDAGAISVKVNGKGGRVVVDGVQGAGSVQLTSAKKVKSGKHTVNVPLSAAGKSAIGSCSVTGLNARFTKGGKKKSGKKSAGKSSPVAPLDRDEAVCSVGSENPTARPYYGPAIDTSNADRCDFMDPTVCLQPWPNDYFTKADASTDTGRRLNLDPSSTPANKNGVHLDPTDFNHADGFSPAA